MFKYQGYFVCFAFLVLVCNANKSFLQGCCRTVFTRKFSSGKEIHKNPGLLVYRIYLSIYTSFNRSTNTHNFLTFTLHGCPATQPFKDNRLCFYSEATSTLSKFILEELNLWQIQFFILYPQIIPYVQITISIINFALKKKNY